MTHDGTTLATPATLRRRRLGLALITFAVLAICVAIRANWGPEPASAEPRFIAPTAQPAKPAPTAGGDVNEVVAFVNSEAISRNDLIKECLRHHGEDVLESLTNKHLIAQHCEKLSITVSPEEVDAEISRMAARFSIPRDQWLKMLEEERQIKPTQYARDIIWPTIALRKLAAARLTVTEEEVRREYETQFGPSVQARLIAVSSAQKAKDIQVRAAQDPAKFGALARQESEDANSASANGLILPIRAHLGAPEIEQVAFNMAPQEVSDVIKVASQFVILKCEKQIPANPVPFDTVRQQLEEGLRDKKLRLAATDVFADLQKDSVVEVVLTDAEKRKANPGVAAIINGKPISMADLSNECFERHGQQILDGVISRKLLEQQCKKRNIEITRADLHQEIARAAVAMGKTTDDGKPDVDAWLAEVTKESKQPIEVYERDTVWPTVALKKLVTASVTVSEEDLKKGFESNFGPRVRCRAIVFGQLRKAQEVFELARRKPTVEHFATLAEQYSVDPSSRSIGGETPPIQRHTGQPALEKEAFELKPGEISGIVQVGDKYVILFCEGRTQPVAVNFEEVRHEIHEDIFEKKLRIAMAQEFTRIQDASTIDNFLAKTSQTPKKNGAAKGKLSGSPAATQTARGPAAPLVPPGATR